MIRRLALVAALLSAGPLAGATLAAQQSPPLVRYGKWVLLAGSAGLNYLAYRDNERADDAFAELERRCDADSSLCLIGPGGAYLDPISEAHYQEALHYDRRTRRWLIAGQTALVGAAVMFIWEFTRPPGRPDNIPFEPEVRAAAAGTLVGLRVAW